MNCKEGDLARVVKGEGEGAICRVIRPALHESFLLGSFAWQVELLSVARVRHLPKRRSYICLPSKIVGARDAALRPIPPEKLQNELTRELVDATPA